ncbi:hypothetical protein [Streptomyces malaysiensis]|nr:hypothetical protein [Streptomyces malaysiensis]
MPRELRGLRELRTLPELRTPREPVTTATGGGPAARFWSVRRP